MKKLKYTILFCLSLLGFQLSLSAQIYYDLKTDIFNWMEGDPSLFVEVILKQDLGIELGLIRPRYSETIFTSSIGNSPSTITTQNFDVDALTIDLSGRYYPFANRYGYGFFASGLSRLNFELAIEDGYEAAFFTAFGQTADTNTWANWELGIGVGYKFLIKSRLSTELEYIRAIDVLRRSYLFVAILNLKVGWRLGP